jgi:predicted GIY-YIG superfamily endonuclease
MYFCYLISNSRDRTYNGYTVNLRKRRRQHNGSLVGGARATKRGGSDWKYVFFFTSPEWTCISDAMKFEWSIKYPTRKRPRPPVYNGALGRIRSMHHVLLHVQEKAPLSLVCYVAEPYADLMKEICEPFEFVTIVVDDVNSEERLCAIHLANEPTRVSGSTGTAFRDDTAASKSGACDALSWRCASPSHEEDRAI